MEKFLKFLEKNTGISRTSYGIAFAAVVFFTLLLTTPQIIVGILAVLVALSPIWLPIVLVRVLWIMWLNAIRSKFIAEQEYVVLEIRLPREIFKSPKAMEAVLAGFHQGPGETTWINRFIEGKVRPWYSLEIVSLEGKVHFYIWTRKFLANYLKDQIYAHYPEVEILEVPDYTRFVSYERGGISLWGADWVLTKEDVYPIKTYVDYELERDPKEEFKVDPLANLLEAFGAIGKGEQMWIQIIIQTYKGPELKDQAKAIIDKIKQEAIPKPKDDKDKPGLPFMTKGDEMVISGIQRTINKQAFEAGIRTIYLAKSENFTPIGIFRLTGSFKTFSSNYLNGFKPTNWDTAFEFAWQGWFGRKEKSKRGVFDAYRRRAFFYYPYKDTKSFVLTIEELATLFHFPGAVVATPTVERIPSRRAEAPSNLPT